MARFRPGQEPVAALGLIAGWMRETEAPAADPPGHFSKPRLRYVRGRSGIVNAVRTVEIEVDDEVLAKLEKLGPVQSRRRSEFISMALRRALWELEERETARAYAGQPDSPDDAYVDAEAWER